MVILEAVSLVFALKLSAAEDGGNTDVEDSSGRAFAFVGAGGLISLFVGARYFQNFIVEPARYTARCNATLAEFGICIDPATMKLRSLKG